MELPLVRENVRGPGVADALIWMATFICVAETGVTLTTVMPVAGTNAAVVPAFMPVPVTLIVTA